MLSLTKSTRLPLVQLLRTSWSHISRSLPASASSSSSSSHRWLQPSAAVSVDEARRVLTVSWPTALGSGSGGRSVSGDEAVSILPLAWLRDACQCPRCFNQETNSRNLHFEDFNPRVPVASASLSADSNSLTVEWLDGHRSTYAKTWLQQRSFTGPARLRRQSVDRVPATDREKPWLEDLVEFNYSQLMQDDGTLLKLLHHLDRHGCLLVKAAPADISVLSQFAGRLAGLLSPSNYGHSFEVKSKANPSNIAFTSNYLGLHIDQCFYGRRHGVQILHCVSQPSDGSIKGGESLLADGYLAAELIRRRLPEYFRALTCLPVDFNDYGRDFVGDFHLINRETVLRLDAAGRVDRVTFSGHSRDYCQNHLDPDHIQLLYEAMKAFYDTLTQPPCIIEHKLCAGDIQVTDNRRVLHGRRAFSVSNGAERFLHGGYVEWDEVYSRMRRLEEAGHRAI